MTHLGSPAILPPLRRLSRESTAPPEPEAPTRESPLRINAYAPSGFVALRSPLLPFGALEQWAKGLRGSDPKDPRAWEQSSEEARRRLRQLLEIPDVREAVFLASPSLDERIHVWLDAPLSDEGSRIEFALVKYLYRMSSRCTPFGLFAGNSVGLLARETRLELEGRPAAVRHTRLDMEFLDSVISHLSGDAEIRKQLHFSTNSSLYDVGETVRYAEARTVEGRRAYFLVDVESHEHLDLVLERAREGATLDEIAEAAVDDEVTLEVARAFVDQLVDARLLVPDLGPVVTGPEAVDDLLGRLERLGAAGEARSRLRSLRDSLTEIDGSDSPTEPATYLEIARAAEKLAPVNLAHFVQVDLVKPTTELTVAEDLVEEMTNAVQVLVDLFAHGHFDPLEEFRQAFEKRYGESAVPLVEALDEEIGIGFQTSHGPGADTSPLIAGLAFPPAVEEEKVGWGARGRFLEWKVSQAIAEGREELVLDPEELRRFHTVDGPLLADAVHIHATLLEPEPTDRTSPRAIIDSAGGPSGARLLGRFCHADPELRSQVEQHLREEESLAPEVRYFELVHLPEGRTGNILARPVLRDLELEYLGTSGAPRDRILRAQDLLVSVRRGRIVLWSRTLDCEVRPRITTAHNVMWRSLGLYRFLSMLQSEGRVEGVMWSWGPLESQPRLPRVRLGRIVLARAQWSIPRSELQTLRKSSGHDAYRAVQAWRSRRGLPRWIGLVDQDNVLTVDLDHPLSVAAMLHDLRSRDEATLQELFPGARSDTVTAPEGRFVNEIVVPVVRRNAATSTANPKLGKAAQSSAIPASPASSAIPSSAASAASPTVAPPNRPRELDLRSQVFVPGSEWLSVKLYCGSSLADDVLVDLLAPVLESATGSGTVDRWFFLRYADPDWHVRIRFRGEPARLTGELLPLLHANAEPFLEDRRVHRVEIDTYVRETLRYGGEDAIDAAEELFLHDSAATLGFLSLASGDDGLDARWRFAFVAMDRLLEDLGFDLEGKRSLTWRLAEMFGEEFHIDSGLRKGLRDRYRSERPALEDLLDERGESSESIGPGYDLLRARSVASRSAILVLRELARDGALTEPIEEIAGSLLHMHANRMLRSAQRAQEMVLYRFLEKTYASRIARRKSMGDPGSTE